MTLNPTMTKKFLFLYKLLQAINDSVLHSVGFILTCANLLAQIIIDLSITMSMKNGFMTQPNKLMNKTNPTYLAPGGVRWST